MAERAINDKSPYDGKVFVEYADPSGGLNTKRDVHALDRNMLAVSINGWPAQDNVIGKRPASTYYVNTKNGRTGIGAVQVLLTSGTSYTVPANFGILLSIECIGAGGSNNGGNYGGGGGGGAYSKITSLFGIAAGSTYTIQVGAGGSGSGTATWFDSTSVVLAAGGAQDPNGSGGAGGQASASVGAVVYSGGAGGAANATSGGGGGGAAGPNGGGVAGSAAPSSNGGAGGAGDAGYGGSGGSGAAGGSAGSGGAGAEYGTAGAGGGGGGDDRNEDGPGAGGNYGGGAGGSLGYGVNGTGGLIVFTYKSLAATQGATSIVATRWTIGGLSQTVLLAQAGRYLAYAEVGATSWTAISTEMGSGAQRIHVAQMFDPLSGVNQCFICNGVDQPWLWAGPGNTTLTQTSVANGLPVNSGGSVGITPRFVTTVGNNSVLCYSGEPTSPTAVYISNAFYPQSFTQSSSGTTVYAGSYQPYLVGFNDGVNGGNVTGITSLQGMIILYKESAIYRGQFTNVYGTVYGFQWQVVSSARGMVAPESLASFDTYNVFLSNDGVYYTDGYQVQQISANVPTFFDGSLNGYGPLCLSYPTAVGVRCGSRYLIWYDRGLPSAPGVAAGYCTSGIWFDFAKTDVDLLPQAGEMHGALSQYPFSATMPVAGACGLNGPYDTGLFVWTSATADQVALFGLGFTEFGGSITTTFAGPADRFPQIALDSAFFDQKHVHSARLAIAAALTSTGQLTFTVAFTTDFLMSTSASSLTPIIPGAGTAVFGTGTFGSSVFGASGGATLYAPVTIIPSASADGRVIQTMISETSQVQWSLLGYVLEVSRRLPVQ